MPKSDWKNQSNTPPPAKTEEQEAYELELDRYKRQLFEHDKISHDLQRESNQDVWCFVYRCSLNIKIVFSLILLLWT